MNNTYEFSGRTYPLRGEFRKLYATWNPATKTWTVRGRLQERTLWGFVRAGVTVTVNGERF